MEPLLDYIERVDAEHPDDYVTIVLPEFVPARWWRHLFLNQRALLIKDALLFKPNTVVTSVDIPPSTQTTETGHSQWTDRQGRTGGPRHCGFSSPVSQLLV
jgi:hypothetical protein